MFLGENDMNSEKGGIYESPPDRYVPTSSSAANNYYVIVIVTWHQGESYMHQIVVAIMCCLRPTLP